MDEAMTDPFSGLFEAMRDAAAKHFPEPFGRVVIPPGAQPVWDECCEGQLHLQPLEMTPLDQRIAKCANPWRVRAALGLIRCIAVVDDYGTAPTAEEVTADGIAGLADAYDLSCALTGPVARVPNVMDLRLIRWLPLGAMGGCAGGEWEFSFTWLGCDCG